ncbi:MAG TPA: hypothetical protein VN577_10190 [Terriglobales bacterium]|nr:hypothetical protein [Terriglobales bacterium]
MSTELELEVSPDEVSPDVSTPEEATSAEFVAPKTFEEFLERYPKLVRSFVYRNPRIPQPMKDDLVQELLLKLVKSRAIERFDPAKTGGTDKRLFFNFVYMVMRREMANQVNKHQTDAFGNLIRNEEEGSEDIKKQLKRAEMSNTTTPDISAIEEFRAFVSKHRPYLLDTLDMILDGHYCYEIADAYGLHIGSVTSRKSVLRNLYRDMLQGKQPRPIRGGRPPRLAQKKTRK